MTKEELKNTYSMKDVIGKYGLFLNRAGFVSCPFHYGDHTASLKIYKDSFYCFGCGASGDIFDFVMRMERCDFKKMCIRDRNRYEKFYVVCGYSDYRIFSI